MKRSTKTKNILFCSGVLLLVPCMAYYQHLGQVDEVLDLRFGSQVPAYLLKYFSFLVFLAFPVCSGVIMAQYYPVRKKVLLLRKFKDDDTIKATWHALRSAADKYRIITLDDKQYKAKLSFSYKRYLWLLVLVPLTWYAFEVKSLGVDQNTGVVLESLPMVDRVNFGLISTYWIFSFFLGLMLVFRVAYRNIAFSEIKDYGNLDFSYWAMLSRFDDVLAPYFGPWGQPASKIIRVKDTVWQDTVKRYMKTADVIVIDVSVLTEHILWELELATTDFRGKLLLIANEDFQLDGAGNPLENRFLELLQGEPVIVYRRASLEAFAGELLSRVERIESSQSKEDFWKDKDFKFELDGSLFRVKKLSYDVEIDLSLTKEENLKHVMRQFSYDGWPIDGSIWQKGYALLKGLFALAFLYLFIGEGLAFLFRDYLGVSDFTSNLLAGTIFTSFFLGAFLVIHFYLRPRFRQFITEVVYHSEPFLLAKQQYDVKVKN